ncbi:MAG: hypothetical protein QXM27_00755 [Candidatus Pacearchaeota archaeon]
MIYRKKEKKEFFSPEEKKEFLSYAREVAEKGYYDNAAIIAAMVGAKDEAIKYIKKLADEKGDYYNAANTAIKIGALDWAREYAKIIAEKGDYYNAAKITAMTGAKEETLEYIKKIPEIEHSKIGEILTILKNYYESLRKKEEEEEGKERIRPLKWEL